ncbi:PaRep2b protein [Pyrobaculum sp.]|uniref:PaRep2b protein n=1 Tax=Pyrobaculum sp. TaxID=2004705 RepID=UPI003167517C
MTGGRVIACMKLNYEKAAVLAALTGDESLRGKKRATLTAKHLFAMARIKGVGWGLLRWYAGVMAERPKHGE